MSLGSVKPSESLITELKANVAEVLELMERNDSGFSEDNCGGYVISCPVSVCRSDDRDELESRDRARVCVCSFASMAQSISFKDPIFRPECCIHPY